MKEKAIYGEEKMIYCSEHLDALVCVKKGLQYHKECYKDTTNKANIKKSKQRCKKMLALQNLLNVANNQIVQKDDFREKTMLKKNVEVPSSYI